MKTITEFHGFQIKNALKTREELTAAGKTAEELPAAMGEALKMEGDKLKYFLGALDTVGNKAEGLKRVVVLTLAESEKAPSGAKKVDEHYLVVEYFPQAGADKKARFQGRDDDRRGGKGKGKGRGKGRRGDREGGRGRGPRRDEGAPEGAEASAGGAPGEGGGRGRRRPPRQPRPETPRVPSGKPPIVLKPKTTPADTRKPAETAAQVENPAAAADKEASQS